MSASPAARGLMATTGSCNDFSFVATGSGGRAPTPWEDEKITNVQDAGSRGVGLKAGALAGLIAGAVFMMMEMGLVAMAGDSPWGPPRMIAAIVMGEGVLPPPATFDLMILMAAMAVHFMLSIVIGVRFALVARRFGPRAAARRAGAPLLAPDGRLGERLSRLHTRARRNGRALRGLGRTPVRADPT